jgi:hypothetical protein
VDFEAGKRRETVRDVVGSVDVQLIVKVMEQLVRGARELAHGGEGQVGGNQEVGQVFGGDFASDGCVVASGAGVFEDGFVVWGEPQEAKYSAVEVWVGGAKIMEGGVRLSESGESGEMERGSRRVTDGNEGARGESQRKNVLNIPLVPCRWSQRGLQ